MTTSDFSPGLDIGRLALAPRDVPHLALETNRTCNMRCRLCYNLDRDYVKSLDDVRADLDTALRLRNLAAVTILGGEPTLYPELPEVISLVKSRGLFCALLTNGLRLLASDGPALLDRIKRAGVDRVYIHVDSGQKHVHADIEAVRERLSDLLEAAGVPFALSVTIYGGDGDDLAAAVRRYSRYRYFEGILSLLAHDPGGPTDRRLDLRGPYEHLKTDLGLEPLSYIPADRDDSDVRWLIYFYVIDAERGEVFPVSARVQRFAQRIFRWAPGRQYFAQRLGPSYVKTALVPILLSEVLLSPRRAVEVLRLIRKRGPSGRKGGRLKDLRVQFITVQSPPLIDFAAKRASVCRGCPDATVRNGRLVPVCIADLVSPLDPLRQPALACPEI
jgi:hypothetical protein